MTEMIRVAFSLVLAPLPELSFLSLLEPSRFSPLDIYINDMFIKHRTFKA